MAKTVSCAIFLLVVLAHAALAGEPINEGRSASCSNMALVCVVMKDGTLKPTSECDAPREGVARVLAGDCFDED